ncbi:MAG TPA: hypothetical protein VE398_01690 [Acidobacteriota bacterium]|nr:hypothetical protein [Acidobacteriota bacterium]
MKAILLFHLRVGGRLALQSFAPLFSAVVALIMLQMYPAAMVAMIAGQVFGNPPSTPMLVILAGLAFALPACAAPRMAHGLNSWVRHLPINSADNRRGLALALIVVQSPLVAGLGILAFVANTKGLTVVRPILLKLLLLIVGAAFAALPVKRRVVSTGLSVSGALLAVFGKTWMMLPALMLLLAADAVCGPLRDVKAGKPWRALGSSFGFHIAWRALGWRILSSYLIAMLPLGFARLFIQNNELTGDLLAGATRFCGSMAIVLFLSTLSERLSVRRPVWPWARSLPWSSFRRVLSDTLFLAAHAALILIPVALIHPESAIAVLLVIPLLAARASGHMRRVPERRTGNGPFVLEGFFVSGILALAPWSVLLALTAAPLALLAARNTDSRQKVTRWLEKHHDAGGDSLSWSA